MHLGYPGPKDGSRLGGAAGGRGQEKPAEVFRTSERRRILFFPCLVKMGVSQLGQAPAWWTLRVEFATSSFLGRVFPKSAR